MSLPPANLQDLYARYGRDVYQFALYLCGNAATAEDLAAETFLRAFTTPGPIQTATAKAYLLAIVRNLNLERLRHARRQGEMPPEVASGDHAGRAAEDRAELARVLSGLRALPEVERAALLLRSSHGLAYDEIGRLLGLTGVTARVKVHRARRKLLELREGGNR